MQTRRHRFLSLRLSTFIAILAVVALGGTIALLRTGGSANSPETSFVPTTRPVSTNLTPEQIYNNAHTGVVKITTGSGLGTGLVLDSSGDILTNDHVVEGANSYTVSFDSGVKRSAKLVGADPSSDLAVVKIDPSGLNLTPLSLGDSNAVHVGDSVYAIGNPFGYTNSFSQGIVSGLDRSMTAPNGFTISHSIQTDAAINPGNSGGPLLNANGEVIGINAQIAAGSSTQGGQGQNDGVGFAIPIDTAKSVISQLEKTGHVSHGYLGIATADASSTGAVVQSVQPNSPAAGAGLQQGDVIRTIDGKTVANSADLVAAISSRNAGDKITLGFERGGNSKTVTITLAQQPSQAPNG